jgi:hypothetical protein
MGTVPLSWFEVEFYAAKAAGTAIASETDAPASRVCLRESRREESIMLPLKVCWLGMGMRLRRPVTGFKRGSLYQA